MLTAKLKETIVFVNDYSEEYLKRLTDEKKLMCPDCNEPLGYRICEEKRNHFFHFKKNCATASEPESIEHETGKNNIYEWMKKKSSTNDCVIEKTISSTNQRADIFVESQKTAIEFQCSPIQPSIWEKRRDLYHSVGIHDFWVLGYSMHTYSSSDNPYTHKLNPLEKEMARRFKKLIYYDMLTNFFVFLYPETANKDYTIGKEYFFKPHEVFWHNHSFRTRQDFFITSQNQRKEQSKKENEKSHETSSFIKKFKKKRNEKEELASQKQIKYIKYLLYQRNRKIPYKLHGLTKNEANTVIQQLKNEKTTP